MIKYCANHKDRELKELIAGPNAKKPGSKYWKCTKLVSNKGVEPKVWCNYVEFEDSFITTKKFTQLPNGQVHEEEAVWNEGTPITSQEGPYKAPERTEHRIPEGSPTSAVRDLLEEVLAIVKAIRKYQLGEHE